MGEYAGVGHRGGSGGMVACIGELGHVCVYRASLFLKVSDRCPDVFYGRFEFLGRLLKAAPSRLEGVFKNVFDRSADKSEFTIFDN